MERNFHSYGNYHSTAVKLYFFGVKSESLLIEEDKQVKFYLRKFREQYTSILNLIYCLIYICIWNLITFLTVYTHLTFIIIGRCWWYFGLWWHGYRDSFYSKYIPYWGSLDLYESFQVLEFHFCSEKKSG